MLVAGGGEKVAHDVGVAEKNDSNDSEGIWQWSGRNFFRQQSTQLEFLRRRNNNVGEDAAILNLCVDTMINSHFNFFFHSLFTVALGERLAQGEPSENPIKP